MNRIIAAMLAASPLLCAPAGAASVTLAGLADSEHGLSYGLDARFSPADSWSLGAGVGRSESSVSGADFAGTSLRLSTDLNLGHFFANAAAQRWKDSGQFKSTTLLGELGWMAESGLSVSALLDDRSMTVDYTMTVQGQPRDAHIDFDGQGFGADISWFGDDWNLGARFIDYSYGRSVDRVRAAIDSANTGRFPRPQLLLDSIVTRAAGAPDRQFAATLGRQFSRSSLQGDWTMERDALTHARIDSLSLTLGYELGAKLRLDTTAGFSDGGAGGTTAFGGLALTLRNQAPAND